MIIIITQITESGQKGSHVGSGRPINLAIWQPGDTSHQRGQPHLIDRHEYLAQKYYLQHLFTTFPLISIICTPYLLQLHTHCVSELKHRHLTSNNYCLHCRHDTSHITHNRHNTGPVTAQPAIMTTASPDEVLRLIYI